MWGDIQNIHCNYTVTPNLPVPTLHSNNALVSNVNGAALLTSESNLPRMLLKQQKSHQYWIQSHVSGHTRRMFFFCYFYEIIQNKRLLVIRHPPQAPTVISIVLNYSRTFLMRPLLSAILLPSQAKLSVLIFIVFTLLWEGKLFYGQNLWRYIWL